MVPYVFNYRYTYAMKKLLLFLFLLPLCVIAQSKKDNTILIQTELSPEEAFSKWGRHLAQSGYSIAESNKDFYTITTGPKDTSRMNYDFIVLSSVKDDGTIALKMKWRLKSSMLSGTRETQYYEWEYRGGKNDLFYNDVMQVISAFGSYPVSYSK